MTDGQTDTWMVDQVMSIKIILSLKLLFTLINII